MPSRSKERTLDIAIAPFEGHEWERQFGWKESPQAYAAFLIYRDMDPGVRTIVAASRAYAEKYNRSPGASAHSFNKWATQYRWQERTTAFDNMMDAKDLAERKRLLVKRTRKQAEVLEKAQEALAEPLRVYQERLQEIADNVRANQLTEKDEDGNDVFSDADLIAMGRAAVKVIIDAQKAEREALAPAGTVAPADDPRVRLTRGKILRRVLGDKEARGTLEEVQFAIAEEERQLESG